MDRAKTRFSEHAEPAGGLVGFTVETAVLPRVEDSTGACKPWTLPAPFGGSARIYRIRSRAGRGEERGADWLR